VGGDVGTRADKLFLRESKPQLIPKVSAQDALGTRASGAALSSNRSSEREIRTAWSGEELAEDGGNRLSAGGEEPLKDTECSNDEGMLADWEARLLLAGLRWIRSTIVNL